MRPSLRIAAMPWRSRSERSEGSTRPKATSTFRLQLAEQVAQRPGGGIIHVGDRARVDDEPCHRLGRAVDQRPRLVGETVGVGVEEISAEAVENQARPVCWPGSAGLVSQPPCGSGVSTMVCGR